jgi:hypothetical protein
MLLAFEVILNTLRGNIFPLKARINIIELTIILLRQ